MARHSELKAIIAFALAFIIILTGIGLLAWAGLLDTSGLGSGSGSGPGEGKGALKVLVMELKWEWPAPIVYPLQNAYVAVYNASGSLIEDGYTNDKGTWVVWLDPGDYTVKITHPETGEEQVRTPHISANKITKLAIMYSTSASWIPTSLLAAWVIAWSEPIYIVMALVGAAIIVWLIRR